MSVLTRRSLLVGATGAIAALAMPAWASDGARKTLASFGWDPTDDPPAQRAAVQLALDSGEPLWWPVGDEVRIDQALVVWKSSNIAGAGPSVYGTVASSVLRCTAPNMTAMIITGDNVTIEGITIVASNTGCVGIAVGDGVTLGKAARGVLLRRVTTHPSLMVGVHYRAAQDCGIWACQISGYEVGYLVESNISNNPLSADAGDNFVGGWTRFLGVTGKPCMIYLSGGGQNIDTCKFVGPCKNHIVVLAVGGGHPTVANLYPALLPILVTGNWGISANFNVFDSSLETCTGISIDMHGIYPFTRGELGGNNWGGVPLIFASRNFYPGNWLGQFTIKGGVADCVPGPHGMIDVGLTTNCTISDMTLRAEGSAVTCGIETRKQSAGALLSTGRTEDNHIIGCPVDIINGSAWQTL